MALATLPHQDGADHPGIPAHADRCPRRPVAAHDVGAAHVHQGGPPAAATPDQRQADYFLQLLLQSRHEIDQQIDRRRRAIADAEARRDLGWAGRLRRLMLLDEQERQVLDRLIDDLQRRFPHCRLGDC
jgi:hypothetical protein